MTISDVTQGILTQIGFGEKQVGHAERRTTLETFAIGAMFDQVLEAANLRLDPMTGGRYRCAPTWRNHLTPSIGTPLVPGNKQAVIAPRRKPEEIVS
jgi:hypothetical protein